MKITNLSLVAIAAMAFTTGAMAEDKGIDFNIGGQAVVYYQTHDAGDADMFDDGSSNANVGIQLNANSDLGNGFGLGLQATALNTDGLEGNLVDNTMQTGNGDLANQLGEDSGNYFAFTKAYLTKKIANTTLKLGRQELPKNLSPFAFSEGWNVFKNTFDAVVAVNSDIPDTTLVGAYVSRTNGNGVGLLGSDLSTFTWMGAPETGAAAGNGKGAYMLTVQNKSLAGLTPTLSYYQLPSLAKAFWLDVNADLNKLAGVPVTVGLQGGQTKLNASGSDAKQAAGIKVAGKAGPVNVSLAYTKVGTKGDVAIHNIGTNVKTPLYTQMVANQGAIKDGADTTVLKVVAPAGPGKLIAQYGITSDNKKATENDYNELDVLYKFKALGTNMLAGYVMQKYDKKTFANGTDDTNNIIRVWSRYNF